MSTGLRVTAETRDEGEVEVELVLEPVDGRGAVVDENLGEIGGNIRLALAGRERGVLQELDAKE